MYYFLGALAAGLLYWPLHHKRKRTILKAWSRGLIIAALIYIVFLIFDFSLDWFYIEFAGVLIYGGLAWLSLKKWPWFIVIGWIFHVLWDIKVHPGGYPGYVPIWYPPLCLGFDLAIAALLAYRLSLEKSLHSNRGN